jgi:hypothetical protein
MSEGGRVYLGIYRFTGEPASLLAAYDRLAASLPAADGSWHLCAIEPDGITVYDTCPSREVFEAFSTSREFLGALGAAGLPAPEVTGRPVYAARGSAPA